MRAEFSVFIAAPIADVFAFFDDPIRAMEFQEHAKSHLQRADVIEVLPDGRRTFDLYMRSGPQQWVQSVVQELREVPTRQLARSYTWTTDRERRISTLSTDRRFVTEDDGTRVSMVAEFEVQRHRLRPLAVILNRFWGNQAFRVEQEHALHFIAEHLEAQHREAQRMTFGDAD